MGAEKIKKLEEQKNQILEKQKKMLQENARKIKALNELIAVEKKKETERCEQIIVSMVRDVYGEITEETIQQFKSFCKEKGIELMPSSNVEELDEG